MCVNFHTRFSPTLLVPAQPGDFKKGYSYSRLTERPIHTKDFNYVGAYW